MTQKASPATLNSTSTVIENANSCSNTPLFLPPKPQNGERHTLSPESELRIELPQNTVATLLLLSGSAELFGAELACAPPNTTTNATSPAAILINVSGGNDDAAATKNRSSIIHIKQRYTIVGQANFAVLTWYGCTIDVEVEFGKSLGMSYISDEVFCNIAYVNTNAQLEALRDEAWKKENEGGGPRVLVVGPADSGKTSLTRVLSAYAVKLGRSPILVDIDPSQNMLSIPGTLIASSPLTPDSISVSSHACSSSGSHSVDHPLVLWYGSSDVRTNVELYKAQVSKLGHCIEARLAEPATSSKIDADTETGGKNASKNIRSSGLLVNTSSWIDEDSGGYEVLLHTISALRITVILVMGHDRLYSMLTNRFPEQQQVQQSKREQRKKLPKVIKLPRSGGVVSRDSSFRRTSRSQSIKRYFYGIPDLTPNIGTVTSNNTSEFTILSTSALVNPFGPTLLQLPFSELKIYKLGCISLSKSMLPVSSKQASDAVQLTLVDELSPQLKHCVLAVCHPDSVKAYESSGGDHCVGNGEELYLRGVAGIVVVEKVEIDTQRLSLLSPCSGSLPSMTLLLGDVVWIE